ncbi:MAG TPA: hypothetical protein VE870_04720 [Bacteroidales bacterium]|nr:hypothetical protein [Bacteroidales bacterium]
MKPLVLVFITLLLMSFQCTKDTDDPIVSQDILFARIYENNAWGHQLNGWFIDNTGDVRGFSILRNPDMAWHPLYEGGFISRDSLLMNLSQSDTTLFKVPLPDLFNYYSLIGEAARGTVTEKENRGADMGQLSNYCLLYFPEEKQYKFVLLESSGDWQVHNISEAAQKINAWLNEISHEVTLYDNMLLTD